MLTCPNCNYKLVLLPNRMKYKCALCSNLYPQKFIENKDFKEWNKLQRQLDKQNLELQQQKQLNEVKQIKQALKLLFTSRTPKKYTNFKEYKKQYYQLNKDKFKQYRKQYYQRNKQKLNQKFKEYYYKNREKCLELDEKWVEVNHERIMLTSRKWLAKNKNKRDKFLKAYRIKNLSLMQQKQRLSHYRKKQKALADAYLKFNSYKASTIKFFPFVPTFALCELLINSKYL